MVDRVSPPLPAALEDRVVVAGGAMGTTLRSVDPSLHDFAGHEWCGEILNVTRPALARGVRRACSWPGWTPSRPPRSGPNCRTSSTEGSPTGSSRPTGSPNRDGRGSCAGLGRAGREADGTRVRDASGEQVKGLLAGGVDAVVVKTSQDLPRTKDSIVDAERATEAGGRVVPIIAG